ILHLVDVRGIVGVDGGFAAPDGLAVLEVEFTDRGGVTVLGGPLVSATTGRLGGDQTREVETGGFSNRLTLDMVVESLGEEVLVVNLVLFIHCSPLFHVSDPGGQTFPNAGSEHTASASTPGWATTP